MEIIYKKISDLVPYENNPRNNEEAVKYVQNSIKEFGFKVPIIIDKNNVVVAGHTRLKACENLGINEVPCITADDLTEEQIKAFRLADNKVGEIAEWDFLNLKEELNNIKQIDMQDFGFLEYENIIDWAIDDEISKVEEHNYEVNYECPNCHKIISEEEIICK